MTLRYHYATAHTKAFWQLETAPHIRTVFRRLFPSTATQAGDIIDIEPTPSKARDLEWFLERYPHDIDPDHRALLAAQAEISRSVERLAAEIKRPDYVPTQTPLATPLRYYQQTAVDLAAAVQGLLVADDLGLGKTAVGIGLIAREECRPAIVVCQTHLPTQWKNQIRKFCPGLKVHIAQSSRPYPIPEGTDVFILPYSKISDWRDEATAKTIVFDEAQELRRSESLKYTSSIAIANRATYRLALTATPVYNYASETWNVIEAIRPGALGNYDEFAKEWCSFRGRNALVDDPKALGSYLAAENIILRRTRVEVGREVPPVQRLAQQVPYKVSAIEDFLKADACQLARTILEGSFTERGQASREFDNKLRQATGIAKAPYVAQLVIDLAHSGKKVVLGGWHRAVYDIWSSAFNDRLVKHYFYTGSESTVAKAKAVEDFCNQPEGAVLILSLRSGAGLDGLQFHSDTVVIGELDWSPQVHEQFIGRVARDGQPNPVTVIYPITEAGSDPTVAAVNGVKFEQGLGITDPSLDAAEVMENTFGKSTVDADTNRSAALARDFLARYAGDTPPPNPDP